MDALKILWKIILIFIGGSMLLGGGICVATNAAFIIPNLFHGEVVFFLMLGGISALVAAGGWVLLKLSGVMNSPNAVKKSDATTENDSGAN